MVKDFENIVKDTFEHFEADVNPQVWTNVQQGLQVSPPAGNTSAANVASSVSKTVGIFSNAGTVITIAAIAVLTAAGTWYFLSDKKENNKSEIVVPVATPVKDEKANNVPVTNETNELKVSTSATESTPIKSIVNSNKRQNENTKSDSDIKSQNLAANGLNQESNNHKFEGKVTDPASMTSSSTATNDVKSTEPSGKIDKVQQEEATKLITTYKKEPSAYIEANPVSGNAPLTVSFLNNGYAKTVSWDFGPGTDVDHSNQTSYTFKTPGTYLVKLTATRQDNTVETDEVTIQVKGSESEGQSSVAEIQNVFTPNGDGYNDVFKVKGNNLSSINAIIFNPSGNQVFQWTDPDGGWDGKLSRGGYATEGTYYYIIEAKGKDGKTYRFKGAVSLIK